MDKNYLKKLKNVNIDTILKTINSDEKYNKYSHADGIVIAYSILKLRNYSNLKDMNIFLKYFSNNANLQSVLERRVKKCWDLIMELKDKFNDDELIAFILYSEINTERVSFENTPSSITKIVLKLLDIKENDNFLELFSGKGSVMVDLALRSNIELYRGVELNYENFDISIIRANIIEQNISLVLNDVLNFSDVTKYNKIFANYPFGIRNILKEYSEYENYKLNIPLQIPKNTSSEWLFNIKIIEHLEKGGKGICVMPNGPLSNDSDKKIRKFFVDNNYVESVIKLPDKLFSFSSIPTSLVVLSHGNENIHFVDASGEFEKENRNNILTDDNINNIIMQLYTDSDVSTIKSIEEISKNDYILNSSNYTLKIPTIRNPVEFGSIIKNITRGSQISSKELDEIRTVEETPYQLLSISNINNGMVEFDDKIQFLKELPLKLEKYCIKENSIVISKIATPNFKTAVVSVDNNKTFLAHGNLFIVEIDEKKADPYYIQALLVSRLGIALLNNIKSGATLETLSIDKLKKIQIPLPDMKIQKSIGNKYAAKMDEIIVLKRRLEKAEYIINQVFEEEGGNC